jgi:hypothetical protein
MQGEIHARDLPLGNVYRWYRRDDVSELVVCGFLANAYVEGKISGFDGPGEIVADGNTIDAEVPVDLSRATGHTNVRAGLRG